jgi:cytochrome c oxidase cbb3-type subunit 3
MSARRLAALSLAAALLAGCHDEQPVRGASRPRDTVPESPMLAAIPLGDWAGVAPNTLATKVANPYERDAAAIAAGGELFRSMNCADCHGYNLKGGMGPDLTDTWWRYGGSPAEIYKSIAEGRPQGMPAWGRALAPELIWRIVAYIESFQGTFPPELADRGRQGDLGDKDTSGARTLRGRQNEDW